MRWLRYFDLEYWQMREALGFPIPNWADRRWPRCFQGNAGSNPYKCGSCEARRLYPELHGVKKCTSHLKSSEPSMSQWKCDTGGDLPPTVYPIGDLREHITDGRPCWCNPTTDDDGIVTHNSADGREQYECGERKAN